MAPQRTYKLKDIQLNHHILVIFLYPLTAVIFIVTFSNVTDEIWPWNSGFELIRKDGITAPLWHCIVPSILFTVTWSNGSVLGYRIASSRISTYDEKSRAASGIRESVAALVNILYPLQRMRHRDNNFNEERLGYTQQFAAYIAEPECSSIFSRSKIVLLQPWVLFVFGMASCWPFLKNFGAQKTCVGL